MQKCAISAYALVGVAMAWKPYHSGEVKTKEKFLYGRFGTRMQASMKMGTVSSFFTFWGGTEDEPWS